MGPKPRLDATEQDLFRMDLVNLIDLRHELVKLAGLIDWPAFAEAWGPKFKSTTGRPALDTRLMASLLYLKHTSALSDEEVVERWIENPYWQHFSGERYFRHELPCLVLGQSSLHRIAVVDSQAVQYEVNLPPSVLDQRAKEVDQDVEVQRAVESRPAHLALVGDRGEDQQSMLLVVRPITGVWPCGV